MIDITDFLGFGWVQIVDRPTQGHKFLSRDYVQPQWVYDCINNRVRLPTDGYVLGRSVLLFIGWPLVLVRKWW